MREMKESGIEWIGKVPKEWKISSIKNFITIFCGDFVIKTLQDDNAGYPVFNGGTKNTGYYDKYNFNGDAILMSSRGANAGYTYLYNGKCWIGNSCFAIICLNNEILLKFLFYTLKNAEIMFNIERLTTTIPAISQEQLKNVKMVFSSLEEQQRIADFLDEKCNEIDSLTSDIQKQIEILQEYKKSVITEAVTKGLDPNVEMISYNNKWFKNISSNNSLKRIKHCIVKMTDGTHGTFQRTLDGRPLLSAKNVFEDGLHIGENESLISEHDYRSITKNGFPRKNDILLCCVGTVGRCAIYNEPEPIAFQRSVIFLRCNKDIILPKMLYYCMQTSQVSHQERTLINKSAQDGLYQGSVSELFITFPKQLDKQAQIIDFLNKKCSEIDSLIEEKNKQLETLEKYKKSLIYEYVTGKKEVLE